MSIILGFLLLLSDLFHLSDFRTNLETKIYSNFSSQKITSKNLEIKTFPLVNEKIKFNFRPKNALVVDLSTDYVVWEKNKDQKVPIASTTKIMTALVLAKNNKLDEIVTIPKKATEVDGSKIPLQVGAKFKVRDLIKAMLIQSANDAALALEINYPKTSLDFNLVGEMNGVAEELGLNYTFFEDSIGLSGKNVSTAWELYLISKEFLKYDFLAGVVQTPETQICDLSKKYCYTLWTTNRLLYEEFRGIKTGYTEEAGNCLVALKDINGKYPTVIIVLGAEDGHIRFEDVELSSQWLEQYAVY